MKSARAAGAETVAERKHQLEGKLEEWKTIPMNVAVIGHSGVGKSSFINAIRGLTADDVELGAAAVDVKEETLEIRSFEHPDNAMLKFWDLPGVGTDPFARNSYVSKINVDHYDFFVLLSANRFTENDTWLGNELHERNKKYFLARTKIGLDISNNEKTYPDTHNEQAVIEKIRQDITDDLRLKNGCEDVALLFLIDNYELCKFEFGKLHHQLVTEFPGKKRSALIFSLPATSEEMIRLKVTELRSRIWKSAALSATGATVPIPGVSTAMDLGIVTHEALSYFRQLGLDSESLQRNAKLHSADCSRMQSIIRDTLGVEQDGGPITVDSMRSTVVMIITRSPTLLAATAVEEGLKVLPGIGSVVAPPLSFAGTKSALNLVLDKFEETALKVMKFVADSAAGVVKTTQHAVAEQTTDDENTRPSAGEATEPTSQEH